MDRACRHHVEATRRLRFSLQDREPHFTDPVGKTGRQAHQRRVLPEPPTVRDEKNAGLTGTRRQVRASGR